jgi:hypothetical protein
MYDKMTYDPTRYTTADEVSEILNQTQLDAWLETHKKAINLTKTIVMDLTEVTPFAFPIIVKSYLIDDGSAWRHCFFDWDHLKQKYIPKGDVWR